jgi:type I restriction enzyme, R subunit
MQRSEHETREQLINPKLKSMGWDILSTNRIVERNKACIETQVTGMPRTSNNPSGTGFVDYVLFGDDGKPLALIEAKKSIVNEEQGRVQAMLYADALERQYGKRPIIYYTNGYTIKIIDGVYPAREVFGFAKKDELEHLLQKRNYSIIDKEPSAQICNRYYQRDAIEEILKHLGAKNSRSLIVLATGTGKTRVSCALSDIFIRNNYVKRILFLADRKNLVVQAKEETYEKFLPNIPMSTLIEGKREGAADARIVFSTYQSMLSIINDTSISLFGIGHFDLIIVDEAHRSLFNKYAEIFHYFDALMIGLTATPRSDIHKSTYKVFNLDNDTPNYEYDIIKGVDDGYLTYYRALDRTPEILKSGVTYDELSEEDKEQYEELFTEDDGSVPEKIEGKEFYSVITNKDTIRAVLRDLMEEGIKVNNGDTLGKTIIFARDHNHATLIQEEFRKMYPELCIPNGTNGADYCVVIDNKIRYNELLQKEFKYSQEIRIVISVDMMDTGVDIPEIVNLVFFKRILSKIKFWQMIGRGTRLCPDIKAISPSKVYFERHSNEIKREFYKDKQGFLVFDICNVFPFFKLNPDGREDKTDQILSLNQKVFMERVALYRALQNNYPKLDIQEKSFYEALRTSLISEIHSMNKNYIGVIRNLKYVEKYSQSTNWLNFKQVNFTEVKKFIAPNIAGEIDIESAKQFDYLCFKFSSTKANQSTSFIPTAKAIFVLANFLLTSKLHISEVANQKSILESITQDTFLTDTNVIEMERVRTNIRELIRYIEKEILEPIISDFDDQISTYTDADEEKVDFAVTIDDFKTLKEKVIFYIRNNSENVLVNQIRNLEKPTEDAIQSFGEEVLRISKNKEEFEDLFSSDDEIVSFIRRSIEMNPDAVASFIEKQKENGFNETQCVYIKELLIFISENGKFSKSDLLRDELNFGTLFDSASIKILIDEIEDIV